MKKKLKPGEFRGQFIYLSWIKYTVPEIRPKFPRRGEAGEPGTPLNENEMMTKGTLEGMISI
jgi:hypothetical protein